MSFSPNEESLIITFSIKNCFKNSYYKISIDLEEKSSECTEKFETEELKCIEEGSEIIFTKKMSCKYFFEKRQKITINVIKKIPIYSTFTTKECERITVLSSLVSSPNSTYERKLREKEKNSEQLCIKLDKQNIDAKNEKNSVFEYFKSGTKFSCFISIDFSDENNQESQNNIKDNCTNILKNISGIISPYIKNHLYYATGFGAKLLNSEENKKFFNLNMNEKDSSIQTIDKVIDKYNSCLNQNKIISENKIYFSPVIKNTTKEIYKLYEMRFYNILFIIIHNNLEKRDIKKTIDAIIESCYLPLTIIIIGVGKNDFSKMYEIFNIKDKFSSVGMERIRNNILFTSLNENFSNDIEKMIQWCLKELSKQMIEYYNLNNSSPQQIYENNLQNIKKSFNLFNGSICFERSIRPDAIEKSTTPFEFDNINNYNNNKDENNNENKKNEETVEDDKLQNINIDLLKENNPYKKDINIIQNNKDNNPNENKKVNLSEKKFVNKKPHIYESVLGNNSINANIFHNNLSNNNSSKLKDNDNKDDNEVSTPIPKDSINSQFEDKNSSNNDENNEKNKNLNENIIENSGAGENKNENYYNTYDDDFKKKESGVINQSNNSQGAKKVSNTSEGGSEFNSTNNSDNIKNSNLFLFDNDSIGPK